MANSSRDVERASANREIFKITYGDGTVNKSHKLTEEQRNRIEVLCQAGGSVNKQYKNGQTAFHNAVSQGDIATVNLLLKYGAKVSIKNDLGLGALEFAISGGKYDILDTICKHLSNLPAEKAENAEAIEFLLTKEKEINTCLARAQSGSLTNLRSFFEKHCQNNNTLKLLGKMGFDSSCQVIYQYSRDKKFAQNKDYTNTVHKLLGEFYQERINFLSSDDPGVYLTTFKENCQTAISEAEKTLSKHRGIGMMFQFFSPQGKSISSTNTAALLATLRTNIAACSPEQFRKDEQPEPGIELKGF